MQSTEEIAPLGNDRGAETDPQPLRAADMIRGWEATTALHGLGGRAGLALVTAIQYLSLGMAVIMSPGGSMPRDRARPDPLPALRCARASAVIILNTVVNGDFHFLGRMQGGNYLGEVLANMVVNAATDVLKLTADMTGVLQTQVSARDRAAAEYTLVRIHAGLGNVLVRAGIYSEATLRSLGSTGYQSLRQVYRNTPGVSGVCGAVSGADDPDISSTTVIQEVHSVGSDEHLTAAAAPTLPPLAGPVTHGVDVPACPGRMHTE